MREAPIRVFDLLSTNEDNSSLATAPALAKLRRLELTQNNLQERTAILASPYLRSLPELELALFLDDPAAVARIEEDLRPLAGLRVLSLHYGRIDPSALVPFATFVKTRGLELVDVRSVNLPYKGIDELRAHLGDQHLLPRPEPRVPFRFGFLDLSNSKLDPNETRALIKSGEFRSATKLAFGYPHVGDDVVADLARAGTFPSLVGLYVGATGITDTGASVLAREAVGLERLETLHLGHVPASRKATTSVSADVVRDLAHSPRLPALRSIVQHQEHHVYTDGAREDREVIPIERGDGRVVEWIIDHTIWP